MSAPFHLDFNPLGTIDRVVVSGEVGLDTVPFLHGLFVARVASGRTRFLVDVDAIQFFDSTTLNLLMEWQQLARVAGGNLVVVSRSERHQRVFIASRALETLTVRHSCRDALPLLLSSSPECGRSPIRPAQKLCGSRRRGAPLSLLARESCGAPDSMVFHLKR